VYDTELERPADVDYLCGSPAKASYDLAWRAQVRFAEIVDRMVTEDLEALT
jgi:GDP-D-mannose dehydratase